MTGKADPRAGPGLDLERGLAEAGYGWIAGLDEAGRGALAGPVVAAAVVLPLQDGAVEEKLAGVRDSKKLTAPQRQHWAERIAEVSLGVGIGRASAAEVDGCGVIGATRTAMQRALADLDQSADYLLLDYVLLPEDPTPQTALTRGEDHALSIAAASVIAKVTRDSQMVDFEHSFPGYGFGQHKGYATRQHLTALRTWGPIPLHRRSFAPVSALAPAEGSAGGGFRSRRLSAVEE